MVKHNKIYIQQQQQHKVGRTKLRAVRGKETNTISAEGKLGCDIDKQHKQQETSPLYVLGSRLLSKVYPGAVSRGF